jgi:hypothetical protein
MQSTFLTVTICLCNVSTDSRSLQGLGPTGNDAMTRVQLQKPNMETKYTLIMRDNGSVVQLMEDGPVPPVVPGVFLVLGFTFGLSLNLVTACTIMMSPVLRRVSFNRILLHLCVCCALDCILNLLAAVGFVVVTRKYRRVLTKRRCEDCRPTVRCLIDTDESPPLVSIWLKTGISGGFRRELINS